MFIRLSTQAYPLTAAQIIAAHPNTSFPVPFALPDGYAAVQEVTRPSFDASTHKLVELAPQNVAGVWRQAWLVVAMTAEERAAYEESIRPPVPSVVTRRQAMRALYLTGKLDLVQPAILALDEQVRGLAQIDWDTAQEFRRDNGTLQLLASALGLDSAALDALFTLAGGQPV